MGEPVVNIDRLKKKMLEDYGQHAMTTASDQKALAHIPYGIPTQSLALDLAIGRPGYPAGRLSEIVAETNQGKSTLLYHAFAECQRMGGVAVLFETEFAYERYRLEQVGVNTNTLLLFQPKTVERMFAMLQDVIEGLRITQRFHGPMVIGIDTIANLPSDVEVEGDFDDKFVGTAARAMAYGFRKFTWTLAEHKIVLIFVNQLIATLEKYGQQLRSYGGSAIHKNSSLRIELKSYKRDMFEVKKVPIAAWVNASIIKTKLGNPFRKTRYFTHFDRGIHQVEDLWQAAITLEVLKLTSKDDQTGILTLGEKSTSILRKDFEPFLLDKFKSLGKFRERLTDLAIAKNVLRPYGVD
jgi:recombination protein RecA